MYRVSVCTYVAAGNMRVVSQLRDQTNLGTDNKWSFIKLIVVCDTTFGFDDIERGGLFDI